MGQVILLSLTVGRIQMMVAWGIGLLTGLLTLRLIRDLYAAYDDADVGLKENEKKDFCMPDWSYSKQPGCMDQ